jgi:Cu2+-exporting ATPase
MTALSPSLVLPESVAGAEARCVHCGSPIGFGGEGAYCCAGCAAAHAVIEGLGLDAFYARRKIDAAARPLKPEDETVIDYANYVAVDTVNGTSTLNLMVDGLQCAACVWLIESVLARDPTVVNGRVNMTTRRLRLVWQGGPERAGELVHSLTQLGFRLLPYDPSCLAAARPRSEKQLLRALTVAGFAAGNVMLLSISVWFGGGSMGAATRDLMHWISALIAMPAILYAGLPFFRSAFGALRAGRANMDVPISVGIVLATGLSLFETVRSQPEVYFDSALTLTFFLLIGRYLDLRARGRVRSAAEQLVMLGAGDVRVIRADGAVELRRAQTLRPGEIVQVAAGERIGVDGLVAEGRSEVDTSLITGETLPQAVDRGAAVYSGTINIAAPLRVVVTATGEGTLLAEIVRLMEAAEHARTRWVALADRVSRAYAPAVHLTALATFLGWYFLAGAPWQQALLYAVAVLIITCPCALALAVPAVQVAASGRLMRQGILVKSPTALERLAAVDTVVFDKTGTLTQGRLELAAPRPDDADLRAAAALAGASRHPLARAICRTAGNVAVAAGVEEHPGQGLSRITADGEIRLGSRVFCGVAEDDPSAAQAELWLSRPGRPAVRFAFDDRLRDDAAATVGALKAAGLNSELLSGDRIPAVQAVAGAAGLPVWKAGLTPEGKVARLIQLQAQGHRVAMIGDGLNDAPALAAADVSISPSTAADVSQTAADIVFQGDRLGTVVEAWRVARVGQRLIRQNIAFAVLYNLCAIPLAIFGQVTPLVAAAAMSSSSIIVTLNALRLARKAGA